MDGVHEQRAVTNSVFDIFVCDFLANIDWANPNSVDPTWVKWFGSGMSRNRQETMAFADKDSKKYSIGTRRGVQTWRARPNFEQTFVYKNKSLDEFSIDLNIIVGLFIFLFSVFIFRGWKHGLSHNWIVNWNSTLTR